MASQRGTTLAQDSTSAPRSWQPAPRPQSCDVDGLVEGVVRLVQDRGDAARIAWRWDRQARVGRARMDSAQMEQALLNVLKNAVEAVQGQGTVTIRLGRSDTRRFVEIEDSGPGILPPSARPSADRRSLGGGGRPGAYSARTTASPNPARPSPAMRPGARTLMAFVPMHARTASAPARAYP